MAADNDHDEAMNSLSMMLSFGIDVRSNKQQICC